MNTAFLNRENELSLLRDKYDSPYFEMVVVYGRRRIGKTQLIAESIKGYKAITCTGLHATEEENLRALTHSIFSAILPGRPEPSFSSYSDLFGFLNYSEDFLNSNFILVLDEYPLLSGSNNMLSSVLQYSIDHFWKDRKIKIVLCGSSISFMTEKVISGDSPLFGRITLMMDVKPFELWEISSYNWKITKEQATVLYSALGGIPRYLNFVESELSFEDNLYNLFFSPSGLLSGETEELLKDEFNETARYSTILNAIATGRSSLNDISQSAGIQTGTASFYLQNLISVGIVKKEIPFSGKSNKNAVYSISDGLFRFVYLFVRPNTNMINYGHGRSVLESIVIPSVPRYMGFEWERICIRYMFTSYSKSRDPFLYANLARWWGGSVSKKTQIEIDMIATFNDMALFGECKWTEEPIGMEILNELRCKAEQFRYTHKFWYLFSKNGFSDAVLKEAEKNCSIKLITLDDIYSFRNYDENQ